MPSLEVSRIFVGNEGSGVETDFPERSTRTQDGPTANCIVIGQSVSPPGEAEDFVDITYR